MKRKICFYLYNGIGKVRRNNEDNFYAQGRYRSEDELLNDIVLQGSISSDSGEIFGVYDGMGGEACGEVASLIAARGTEYYLGMQGDSKEVLQKLCIELNRRICDYANENCIGSMGSTAAMALFTKKGICFCNLGDSRIYKLDKEGIRQLSRDHVLGNYHKKKAPLTQYLGMPEDEILIEPHLSFQPYRKRDRYLLCSDGITDMVSDEEIYRILRQEKPVEDCTGELVWQALKKGGVDNITAIVFEISENRDGRKTINEKLRSFARYLFQRKESVPLGNNNASKNPIKNERESKGSDRYNDSYIY